MLLYFLIMGNYRKVRFMNREFTHLSKPEQKYIGKLAIALLQIQNSGEAVVKKQSAETQDVSKTRGINDHTW